MKTRVSKKISSLVLALAIAFTAVLSVSVVPVNAATKGIELKKADPAGRSLKGAVQYLVNESGTATSAGVETQKYAFTLDKEASILEIDVLVLEKCDVTVKLYKSGTFVDQDIIYASDSYWEYSAEYGDYGNYTGWKNVPAGDYSVSLTFGTDVAWYAVGVAIDSPEAKISQEKATITVGFTKKLSVSNGTVKSWTSSKTSVATVGKTTGKVTAKKTGTATITATLTDGTKLKCKVTVKANKYTASALTVSDVYPGDSAMSAYNVAYDSKGNLVIKTKYVNRIGRKVVQLKNIKITVKDANGKTVGTYTASKKSVSVPNGSVKTYTFTIAKSKLKIKKAELRGGTVTTSGTSVYYY